jgi:iron complex transport system substrate-binding protein
MVSAFLIITACSQLVVQENDVSTEQVATDSECRTVQHKLGEVCIPITPQRIVALDPPWTLDPLLALNIKPAGTTFVYLRGEEFFPGLSSDEVAGIEIVGTVGQPSLEKLLALKPDLILGLDAHDEQNYEQLSAIAPTVLREYDKIKLSFRENFRAIAELVNREEQASEVLAQYQKRVEESRKLLSKHLEGIEVSVIVYSGGSFLVPPRYANYFQLLNDIGVRLKPVFATQNEYVPFSIEVIGKYDADILFIVNDDRKPLPYFFQNPLISSLKAFKDNRVYVVNPDIWWSYGPLGMNKLLDDISEYLLKAAQNS